MTNQPTEANSTTDKPIIKAEGMYAPTTLEREAILLQEIKAKEPNPIWLGGNTPRLTPYQKNRIRKHCLDRDGSRCMICGEALNHFPIGKSEVEPSAIDHIDGNLENHLSSNFRLTHHSCNSKKNNLRYKNKLLLAVRKNALLAPLQEREPISAEIHLNRNYEPVFRRKMFEKMLDVAKKNEVIDFDSMRKQLRTLVGCSQQSSYSYMEPLVDRDDANPFTPFWEDEDKYDGVKFIRFRDNQDKNLTVEELEKKYPKEGRVHGVDVERK